MLAEGSDIRCLALAGDGALYASVTGLGYTLYKSIDDGYSWSPVGNFNNDIVDIVVDAADAGIIYCATARNIYKSTDGGGSFQALAAIPAVSGGDMEITSLDVTRWDDSSIVICGTKDGDADEYGSVYILEEETFSHWRDLDVGDFDVYAVAFSPGSASNRQMVAVVTDENDSYVTTRIGDSGWGQAVADARLEKDNSGASLAIGGSADIAFPYDYSSEPDASTYIQFIAVNTGGDNGDVYAVYGGAVPGSSEAVDLNIGSAYGQDNADVASLAICGDAADARLLAGAAGNGQVYYSDDGGNSWLRSSKEPTGQFGTLVVMADGFSSYGKAYAATGGAESALSITLDGGATWNQLGLIDTRIDSIIELAVSPDYRQDSALFLLTWGGDFSLWRSLDGGSRWQRIFSSALDGIDSFELVELSPQYGSGSCVVFLAGRGAGDPAIWRSADNGQSFARQEAPLAIDCWAVADDTSLFIAGYDGSNGIIYYTSNGGRRYSSGTVAGNQSLSSIALSPEYNRDGTILAGNSHGWVFWSDDSGDSFQPLPPDAASPPLTGNISVAFDPEFGSNDTVYASSDSPDGGIYIFTIGDSTEWESIDDTLPAGGMVGEIAISDDGILYATNCQQVDDEDGKGGMERCLEPTSGAVFETVTRGLDDGATLLGLWLCDNRLWSIDTTNTELVTYIDNLTQPVSLLLPGDRAPGIGTIVNGAVNDAGLDWETLGGATSYQWQLDDDNDFSSIPDGFEGTTTKSSVDLPGLEPAATYHWRVRVVKPVLSPWSDKRSFTTSLGGEITAPRLESPQAGATGVAVTPVFQWSAVAMATGYELVVSSSADFSSCEISQVDGDYLPGNAWQPDSSLAYGTTYYWKVRAINSSTNSAWSAVGVFTTEAEPATPSNTGSVTTITTGLTPTSDLAPGAQPSQNPITVTNTTPGSTTAVTTIVVSVTTPPPSLSAQTPSTPEWLYYVMGFAGAVIIILLGTVMVLVIKRH